MRRPPTPHPTNPAVVVHYHPDGDVTVEHTLPCLECDGEGRLDYCCTHTWGVCDCSSRPPERCPECWGSGERYAHDCDCADCLVAWAAATGTEDSTSSVEISRSVS